MQDEKDLPEIAKPEGEQKSPENDPVAPYEREREKDNRAEAFRALKRLGRGRRR